MWLPSVAGMAWLTRGPSCRWKTFVRNVAGAGGCAVLIGRLRSKTATMRRSRREATSRSVSSGSGRRSFAMSVPKRAGVNRGVPRDIGDDVFGFSHGLRAG